MNPITDIWRQLVRRRLWPVAVLLVGALAAVPVLLAKDPEPNVPPASPVAAATDDGGLLATEPIVAEVAAADPDAKRRPLGKRHDIFKPTKKKAKAAKAQEEDKGSDDTGGAPPEDDTPDDTGGGSTPPSTPATPVDPAPAPQTFPANSLIVRFTGDGEPVKGYLPRNAPLPSRAEPLIIYLGLEDKGKTAVFMLDASIQAVGDGECDPTPEICETVRMRVGDTMFFDVVGEDGAATKQFQLDLLKINRKRSSDTDEPARTAGLASAASRGAKSLPRVGSAKRSR